MATPEDIIESKRIANARRMAQAAGAAPTYNPNALAELQASIAASKQTSTAATEALKQAQEDSATALQAQLDAARNAGMVAAQTGGTIDPITGLIKPPAVTPTKVVSTGKKETRREMIGSGPSRILRVYYDDNTFEDFPAGETPNVNTNSSSTELLALIASLQNTIANLSAKSTTDTAAAKAAADLKERQSAFDVLYAEMDALGLAALVEPLRGLIQRDVSPSEFAVELRQSEAYKMRFAANDARLKKGLRVLQPGEYIRVEDAYRQTLRSYGLSQFDNDAYVRQFIENDISAAELSDRVSMAVQRVQNADPAITRTLRDYYGIGQADLVAYVLDPNQQLQKIQRQIAAAEIGTAARVQGIEAGVGVAEQLAAQGITQAQAQKGYATIADILPTAEKLSQIYGATMEGYDLGQAEQEVFNQLASAQRRRERLTQREVAEFSGQSGVARGSLAQPQQRGQF